MMKQAQKVQEDMAKIQEGLAAKEIGASAGGGVVTAVVDGKGDLKKIRIKPEIVNPEEIEILEDLILAAVTEGKRKADALMAEEMGKLTGGLGLPPGLI